jgi:hypothetical protein
MKPAEAFHPSVFIREEMGARGWSIDAVVQAMQPKDAREHAVLTLAMGMYLANRSGQSSYAHGRRDGRATGDGVRYERGVVDEFGEGMAGGGKAMSEIGIGSTVWGLEKWSGSQLVELVVDGESSRSWEFTLKYLNGRFPKKIDSKGERWTGTLKNWRGEYKFQIFLTREEADAVLTERERIEAERSWRNAHQSRIGQAVSWNPNLTLGTLRQIAALVGYKESA